MRDMINVYRTIVADPPWRPSLHRNTVGRREGPYRAGPQRYYPLMDVYDICRVLQVLPYRIAAQAHLWLWCLNQHVDWGYRVARAWGFEPQQMITWAKPGLGIGQFQCNSEQVLVCRKGGPHHNAFGKTGGTWFEWPRGRHSEKPAEFFSLVERVSRGPYLELFARTARAGWEAWGNEISSGVDMHEFQKEFTDSDGRGLCGHVDSGDQVPCLEPATAEIHAALSAPQSPLLEAQKEK